MASQDETCWERERTAEVRILSKLLNVAPRRLTVA